MNRRRWNGWGDPSDWDCPQTSWIERSVLVLSNLVFLVPFAYCLHALIRHKRLKWTWATSSAAERTAGRINADLDFVPLPDQSAGDAHGASGANGLSGSSGRHDRSADTDVVRFGPGRRLAVLLPEMLTCLAVTGVSAVYHMCADGRNCTRVCVTDWDSIYKSDFAVAFQLLCITLLHTRETRTAVIVWKWAAFVMCLALNAFFANYVLDPPVPGQPWMPLDEFYGTLAGLCAFLLLVRACLDFRAMCAELRQSNPVCAMLAIGFVASGLYFQLSAVAPGGIGGTSEYWWKHSIWHVSMALASTCRFLMTSRSAAPGSSPPCCRRTSQSAASLPMESFEPL